jgi:hypothetical protein
MESPNFPWATSLPIEPALSMAHLTSYWASSLSVGPPHFLLSHLTFHGATSLALETAHYQWSHLTSYLSSSISMELPLLPMGHLTSQGATSLSIRSPNFPWSHFTSYLATSLSMEPPHFLLSCTSFWLHHVLEQGCSLAFLWRNTLAHASRGYLLSSGNNIVTSFKKTWGTTP